MKIDCAKYAQELLDLVKESEVDKKLVIISVGDNPASASYVKGKLKDCAYCEIPAEHIKIEESEHMSIQLFDAIMQANADRSVGGIIVQLPLPGLYEDLYTSLVAREKDVDGFRDDSPFYPCTPEGIMYVLSRELDSLAGKNVLLIGKGKLVGRPLVPMLLDEHCTLTIASSRTTNLTELCSRRWDVIITAVGKANLLDLSMVDADVVIDAGITRNEHGKLCGDCYNNNERVRYTTVPGGIGLMTRAILMSHMVEYN